MPHHLMLSRVSIDLDTGKYDQVSSAAILYAVRLSVRAVGCAHAMLKHSDWLQDSQPTRKNSNSDEDDNEYNPATTDMPPPPPDNRGGGTGGSGGKVCGACWNAYVRGLAPTSAAAASHLRGFVTRTMAKLRGPIKVRH